MNARTQNASSNAISFFFAQSKSPLNLLALFVQVLIPAIAAIPVAKITPYLDALPGNPFQGIWLTVAVGCLQAMVASIGFASASGWIVRLLRTRHTGEKSPEVWNIRKNLHAITPSWASSVGWASTTAAIVGLYVFLGNLIFPAIASPHNALFLLPAAVIFYGAIIPFVMIAKTLHYVSQAIATFGLGWGVSMDFQSIRRVMSRGKSVLMRRVPVQLFIVTASIAATVAGIAFSPSITVAAIAGLSIGFLGFLISTLYSFETSRQLHAADFSVGMA